jgi:hypothetical protein
MVMGGASTIIDENYIQKQGNNNTPSPSNVSLASFNEPSSPSGFELISGQDNYQNDKKMIIETI